MRLLPGPDKSAAVPRARPRSGAQDPGTRPPISLAQPGPLSLDLLRRGVRLVVQPGCKEQGPSEDPATNWSKNTLNTDTERNQNRALQRTSEDAKCNLLKHYSANILKVLHGNRLQLQCKPFLICRNLYAILNDFLCCMFVCCYAKLCSIKQSEMTLKSDTDQFKSHCQAVINK